MTKHKIKPAFTFINPNSPKAFERQLYTILLDKLLYQYHNARRENYKSP